MEYFGLEEIQSSDERHARQYKGLREMLDFARGAAPAIAERFEGMSSEDLTDAAALATLPVLRKSELVALQAETPPFGGLATRADHHYKYLFMSPGPIFEPGGDGRDWWRIARFLHAAGLRMGDIVQNCFAYHLTPAGHMFDSAVAAISATCIPAGTGNTDMQVEAAARLSANAYAGTPDYLKVILDRAEEMGRDLSKIAKATVGGGALFPSLRQEYEDRGITCRQCYATADAGLIAYESTSTDGMIVDEGVILEIVTPGTGDPVAEGEVGEVVVTVLNSDYPLIRFATGDLSAVHPGTSPCGRTNTRIKGWMGRADQTTKIKGMFVRPEQVAELVARHAEIGKARVVVTRADEQDVMDVKLEADGGDADAFAASVRDVLKLKGAVEVVAPGSLPKDGLVIEDQRSYD